MARLKTNSPSRLIQLALVSVIMASCNEPLVLGERRDQSCDLSPNIRPGTLVSFSTFWKAENKEDAALTVLEDRLAERDLLASRTTLTDRASQSESLNQWLTSGNAQSTDVFQANGGSDFLRFVENVPPEDADLCPLSDFAREHQVLGRYFDAALAPHYCGDTLYALPIGIHRINILYVNTQLYARALAHAEAMSVAFPTLSEVQSVEAFLEMIERVASFELDGLTGEPLIPISLDVTSGWPLQVLAHDTLLSSYSAEAYRATWMGRPGGESDEDMVGIFRQLAADVRRLGQVSNAADAVPWTEAIALVARGEALFTVMGDWGSTVIEPAQRDGVELVPFPGAGDNFVYTVDSFAVPRRWDNTGAAAYAWLAHVTNHDSTRLAFAAAKHAIPPVKDLSAEEIDGLGLPYLASTYQEFQRCDEGAANCELLLAVSGLAPASGIDPCFEETASLLAHIAGAPDWSEKNDDSPCKSPIPATSDEAEEQLIEKLLSVSRTAFASSCRQETVISAE